MPGLGVDRANADPEHLNRRPSVNRNTQELTAARRFALVVVAVQPEDVTLTACASAPAAGDAPEDVELTALPQPTALTVNRTAPSVRHGWQRRAPSAPGIFRRRRRETISQSYSVPPTLMIASSHDPTSIKAAARERVD
jgi:hypothetical protein